MEVEARSIAPFLDRIVDGRLLMPAIPALLTRTSTCRNSSLLNGIPINSIDARLAVQIPDGDPRRPRGA